MAVLFTYTQGNVAEPGVVVTLTCNGGAPAGYVFPTDPQAYTSDSNGRILVQLPMGVEFTAEVSGGNVSTFTTPTTGTQFNVPGFVGSYL